MSKTIVVGWGACAPIRPEHVLTQLTPYGVNVKNLTIDVHSAGSDAYVTVNDAQARVAEYWLLRSGLFGLYSPPIDKRNIKWARQWHTMPVQKGCEAMSTTGMIGRMPDPNRERKRKPRKATRRRTNARQRRQQDGGGVLGTIARLFR